MRHCQTTGNSYVAIQTGSTLYLYLQQYDRYHYNSDSKPGISTTVSSQKVSTSDCNIERQPEIAIWSPKPELVIPLELQQIASQFERQVGIFDYDELE